MTKPAPTPRPRNQVSTHQDLRHHVHPDQAFHPETCLRCKVLIDWHNAKEAR